MASATFIRKSVPGIDIGSVSISIVHAIEESGGEAMTRQLAQKARHFVVSRALPTIAFFDRRNEVKVVAEVGVVRRSSKNLSFSYYLYNISMLPA